MRTRRVTEVPPREGALPLLAALIAVPLAGLMRFGYGFGFSDQDEFLPWLRARIEPGLLQTDWFVSAQLDGFSVRSGFVWLLDPIARVAGVETAVFLIYAIASIALVWAVFLLARVLGASPLGSFAAPFLALVLLTRWTLGGNAAWSSMLVPSMLAWALVLWAAYSAFRSRFTMAGILVGIGAWIQILVAAQMGAVLLLAILWRDRRLSGDALSFSLPALLLAAPVAFLLLASGNGMPAESLAVLATVRAPHHYLPNAFPARDYAQFGILLAGGILAFRHTRLQRTAALNRLLVGCGVAVIAAIVLGLGGWMTDSSFIVALQPFKATVFAQILLTAGIAALMPDPRLPTWVWGSVVVAAVAAWGWVLQGGELIGRPHVVQAGPMATTAVWALDNAPPDARLAVPPSTTGFRFASGRAIVANFKAYPFSAEGTAEWLRRMEDWAPGAIDEGQIIRSSQLLPALDAAYERLSGAEAARLMASYDVDYLVRRTPLADTVLIPVAELPDARIYARRP